MNARPPDVLVVGAGISGLALAVSLADRGMGARVLDAAADVGGNLRTRRTQTPEGTWLLDLGPNSFGDASVPFMELVKAAGIEDRLVRAPESANRRWIWRGGRLREVPSHPVKFLMSGLLPLSGMLRIAREPWIAPRPASEPEESLGAFCDRRLGRVAREKLLTPVVGGIYAGDPMQLGAESAFPAMIALEREHGSLIRAARKGKGPPSRGTLSSFRDGLAELPAALRRRLGDSVTTGAAARFAVRENGRWRVETADGRSFTAPTLALATPADVTASLLRPFDAALAAEVAAIPYAPMTVVHVGFRTGDAPGIPPGFGFLVPREEGLRILGSIFTSRLFPGRAPEGFELLTVFAGGSLDPEAMNLGHDKLREFVTSDLRCAIGLAAAPALFEVTRWPRAIPQYVVGHKDRLARIAAAAAAHPGLRLLGNWRGGIAMPECARNAKAMADDVYYGRA